MTNAKVTWAGKQGRLYTYAPMQVLRCNFFACSDTNMLSSLSVPFTRSISCTSRSHRSTAMSAASQHPGMVRVARASTSNPSIEGTKERIKKLFDEVELSVSSYDTAWVAMVPSPNSPEVPCFPECVNWLLNNQLQDGSWSLPQHHLDLTKDALSSTLACLLALKRWDVGEQQIVNGLQFIESNFASITDEKQHSPVGFDIIFPGMIEHARSLNLNLPLRPTDIDALLHKRDQELSRGNVSNSKGRKAYLAYVSEGLGNLQDWKTVMKYQRKNGSLFNSPSTTAAALTHLQDPGCYEYLQSLIEKSPDAAVPAVYPLHIYTRLRMIDTLERLGIDQHFRNEIKSVLDETYRCWTLDDEEIFMDTATCAMAFRILRHHGYETHPDPSLARFAEEDRFFNTLDGYLKDRSAILELYKASQMSIHIIESTLDDLKSWTSHFLQDKSSSGVIHTNRLAKNIFQEVDDALKFPYHANLEPLMIKTNIEHYDVDNIRVLKTSYSSPNTSNKDFLRLAVEDFNTIQSVYRKEFEDYKRWIVEKRLDTINFPTQKLDYCYLSAAATFYCPELSDARILWAKNALLSAMVDELFDAKSNHEEDQANLIKLVEKMKDSLDVNVDVDANCLSEQCEILYSALHSTISEAGEKASVLQERRVTSYIIDIWLDFLKSMFKEAEWVRSNSSGPSHDEYAEIGYHSVGLGPIVLPALYFVGPKLSEEDIQNPELIHNLYRLVAIIGRLFNDIHGFQREAKQGNLINSVSLTVIQSNGAVTEDKIIEEMKWGIDYYLRRALLLFVLHDEGCSAPKACKNLFWKMSKLLHLFYMKDDGLINSTDHVDAVKAVIHEPLVLNECEDPN